MYKKILNFKNNEANKELIIHSFVALLARGGGAIAAFLMNIIVARYLGAEEAGYFFLAITVSTIVTMIGRIGADNAVLKFVSVHSAKEEWDDVHGLMKSILSRIWIFTSVIAVIFCLCSKTLSVHLFHKEKLTWPLFWISVSMPFFAVYNILAMALQGRRKVLFSVTVLKIASPLLLMVLMFVFSPKNSTIASMFYTITSILTVALAYFWWYKSIPAGESNNYDFKLLWASCLPLWLGSIMQQVIMWGGQFVAGIYNSPAELAQLAVARNTTVLITFIMTAINYVSAPRFAAMYNQGKMDELRRYARNTTWVMTLVGTPVVIFIWIFPGLIMSLFGKDFSHGIWLLRILAVGQYINVITGSVAYLLMMSGNEKDLLTINVINGILAIVLAFILNPLFGAVGSAMATAIVVAISNLMAVGFVKKRLGFNIMSALGLAK